MTCSSCLLSLSSPYFLCVGEKLLNGIVQLSLSYHFRPGDARGYGLYSDLINELCMSLYHTSSLWVRSWEAEREFNGFVPCISHDFDVLKVVRAQPVDVKRVFCCSIHWFINSVYLVGDLSMPWSQVRRWELLTEWTLITVCWSTTSLIMKCCSPEPGSLSEDDVLTFNFINIPRDFKVSDNESV